MRCGEIERKEGENEGKVKGKEDDAVLWGGLVHSLFGTVAHLSNAPVRVGQGGVAVSAAPTARAKQTVPVITTNEEREDRKNKKRN